MRKVIALVASVVAVAALAFAPTAFADSPHYIKGPTATVSGNSLTVSWEAAGLGNTVTSVDFSLTGTADVTSQCFTKSGNPVSGVPKSETINVNVTGTFPVRKGQDDRLADGLAPSTLTCTGNQHVHPVRLVYPDPHRKRPAAGDPDRLSPGPLSIAADRFDVSVRHARGPTAPGRRSQAALTPRTTSP